MLGVNEKPTPKINLPFYPPIYTHPHTHTELFLVQVLSIFAGSFEQRMASRKNKNKIKNYWSH